MKQKKQWGMIILIKAYRWEVLFQLVVIMHFPGDVVDLQSL